MAPSTAAALDLPPAALGRRFLLDRVGSLIGIAPLGLWTTVHLWNNLAALDGAAAWSASVTHHENVTGGYAGFVALVAFLVWHTVWGLQRLLHASPNAAPHLGNVRYWLQRLAGIGLLLFLGAHLYLAKLDPLLHTGRPETFNDIAAHMAHHLPTLLVYLLGVLGIAFHLGNGLWSFSFSFGLVSSQRGLRTLTWLSGAFALFLLAVGWVAVYALWHAGQPLPTPLD